MDAFINSGLTSIDINESEYTWTIKNYSYCNSEVGYKIVSPEFSAVPGDKLKWVLDLYPNGIQTEDLNYLTIILRVTSDDFFPVEVEYSISIRNMKEAEKSICFKTRHKFNKKYYLHGFQGFTSNDLLSKNPDSFLVNDQVVIHCKYVVIYGDTINFNFNYLNKVSLSKKLKLLDDIENQFENDDLCDFTIIAPCGKKIRAHKFILASRSPVFSRMLKTPMKEKVCNEVEIKDISADALKEMLRFMYTGSVENIEKTAYSVVMAADKYEIEDLKCFFEDYFFENISIQNAINILSLSQRFNMNNLKNYACHYIKANGKTIMDNLEVEKLECKRYVSVPNCKIIPTALSLIINVLYQLLN